MSDFYRAWLVDNGFLMGDNGGPCYLIDRDKLEKEMSEIDGIIADEDVVMTSALVRAFKMSGCDPACHCCGKEIKIGEEFKLACVLSVENTRSRNPVETPNDEMLCSACTPKKLIAMRRREQRKTVAYHIAQGGGFTRKSAITYHPPQGLGHTRKHKD